jgi:hypothetical protein
MHGIIAMSRELQDMLPPHTKGSHAVAIISGTRSHGAFSLWGHTATLTV